MYIAYKLLIWIYFSDVTKLLLYTAQACHELVPPDVSLIHLSIAIYVILNTVIKTSQKQKKFIFHIVAYSIYNYILL